VAAQLRTSESREKGSEVFESGDRKIDSGADGRGKENRGKKIEPTQSGTLVKCIVQPRPLSWVGVSGR